jgi:hypothetical protein
MKGELIMSISARALLAAIFIFGVGVWSVPTFAQQQPAPAQQQPSANAIALARQYLDLKAATNVYQGSVPGIIERIRIQLLQNNLNYQKDLNEVAARLNQDLKGRDSEIGDEMARIYATDFTEQELKDLLAFYKSPLGQKLLKQEPNSIHASMEFMGQWAEKFGEDVDTKFRDEMKKRGKPVI